MRSFAFLGLLAATLFIVAPGTPHAASPRPAQKAAVDPALLEFLADWQGADGDWVDPMTFARIDPSKMKAGDTPRHNPAPDAVPGAASAPSAQGDAR